MMKVTLRSISVVALCSLPASLWMTGCGSAPGSSTGGGGGITVPTGLHGTVHGALQAVSGATVQLYAAGNKGIGSASTALVNTTVTTDASGSFDLTGKWSCTDTATYGSDPQLYVVARGGSATAGGSNSGLALMAALGPCSGLGGSVSVSVNEVTMVASVYALAPFMVDATHVGASDSAALGRAAGSVATLVNTGTGASPGPSAATGATVPVATINTLANAVASCSGSGGSSACSALFSATQVSGGQLATDTLSAILQVAHAPLNNPVQIYQVSATKAVFQPALGAAPGDWTLSVKYSGGGLSGPAAIAIDALGNAWVANGSGAGVTGLSSQGVAFTGASGYTAGGTIFGAQGIAVDKSGNVWVADTLLSKVVKLAVSGSTIQQSAVYTSGIDGPIGIAVDSQNRVWVANFTGASVVQLAANGSTTTTPRTAGGTLQAPIGVAIDSHGNAWFTDYSAADLVEFDGSQNLLSGAGFSDHAMVAPLGVAIDAAGNVWVADSGNGGVSLFVTSGASQLAVPVTGSGLAQPNAVAVDGSGVAWVTGASAAGLTQIMQSGVATRPLGTLNAATSVAIDASGSIWITNSGDDSVIKFIGLAAPVTTPLSANVGP